MTKLKNETKRVENAIDKLKGELLTLDKNKIQETINDKQSLIGLLETLLEDEEIQKKYPKYNKMKHLLYILHSVIVAALTIALILTSIILGNITFTTFLPLLIIAADYVTYHYTSLICDKKILDNEKVKPYNDVYGDKQYSAKRTLKDLREAKKDFEMNNELLEECNEKETQIQTLQGLLSRLNDIRDNYIEQNLKEDYSKEEIDEIATLFEDYSKSEASVTPKQFIKK